MARVTGGTKPDAFLSYARLDDQVSDGYISWLRDKIEGQVNAEIGKGSFWIFQDTDEIRAGEHWASALDEALAGARFLIPILSPSYFASQPCLFELARFHGFERASGRKDLIIPIYFRDAADHWDDPANPHAVLLRERQVFDWRQLRHRRRDDPEMLERVERLARDIKVALLRTAALARATAPPVAVITAPEAQATLQQELAELRAALEQARDEAARARQKLQATELARSEAEAGARELRAERQALEQEVAAAKSSLSEAHAEADQLRARLEGAERASARLGLGDAAKPEKTGAAVRLAPQVAAVLIAAGISAAATYFVVAGRGGDGPAAEETSPPAAEETPASSAETTLALGEVLRDCGGCPEMVVIPARSFTMGSPPTEEDRQYDEGPQREVTFAQPFAIGRHEVTFAEWDACVTGGGCGGYRPDDRWGRGQQPVVNVSWNDAQSFASWLSRQTGEAYRLPTEAEWEYAARGGTTTPFWTGATVSTTEANYDGNYTYGSGVKGIYRAKTVAVDDPAFPANPFGLLHVHGNVWEWVQDCYVDTYGSAPADGTAVDRNTCPVRVLRGGCWNVDPR